EQPFGLWGPFLGLPAQAAPICLLWARRHLTSHNTIRPKMRKIMRIPRSIRGIEDFGRIRLSKSFFMRDFLHSEIAASQGFLNLPEDGDLAVFAGSMVCEHLLEPMQATFVRIALRSG